MNNQNNLKELNAILGYAVVFGNDVKYGRFIFLLERLDIGVLLSRSSYTNELSYNVF